MTRRLLRVLALLALPAALWAQGNATFPHARHANLFPVCSGCHVGVTIADPVRAFPSAGLCATCHDGVIQPRVQWTPPGRRAPGLLAFTHQQHEVAAKGVGCAACHARADSLPWMSIVRTRAERCVSCHTHGASTHLADATPCATCHRTLATAVALTDARIAALPTPPSHARADYAATHGASARAATASCATCHARESCQRCHVDGAREPAIRALGADARVARLVAGRPAVYPTPADHRGAQFALLHGDAARAGVARCATCHARPSCEACHTGDGAREILGRLPDAREATAPGVQLHHARQAGLPDLSLVATVSGARAAPPLQAPRLRHDTTLRVVRVHATGFTRAHGAQAASGAAQCASCHAQRFCADCHTGERVTRRYHAANFVSTHAPQAYRRETDCSSCHSAEAFCRDCHRQAGLSATGHTRSSVFHNAQPLWLLQHGRAARQDLKSCTSCHQQTYCMQCHSDLGSRISPHGPDFDAARMSSRNPRLCLYCHFKNPLGR